MEIDIFLDIGRKVYESLKFVLFKQAYSPVKLNMFIRYIYNR
jgi:hypothetical protein